MELIQETIEYERKFREDLANFYSLLKTRRLEVIADIQSNIELARTALKALSSLEKYWGVKEINLRDLNIEMEWAEEALAKIYPGGIRI